MIDPNASPVWPPPATAPKLSTPPVERLVFRNRRQDFLVGIVGGLLFSMLSAGVTTGVLRQFHGFQPKPIGFGFSFSLFMTMPLAGMMVFVPRTGLAASLERLKASDGLVDTVLISITKARLSHPPIMLGIGYGILFVALLVFMWVLLLGLFLVLGETTHGVWFYHMARRLDV